MSAKTQASKAAQKAKFEARKAELAAMPAWQGPRLPIVKPVVEAIEVEEITVTETIIDESILRAELQAAAYRAEIVNAKPASAKQVAYLASLMVKAGEDLSVFDANLVLTSTAASKRIDALLNH